MGKARSARYIAERLKAASQTGGAAALVVSEKVRADGVPFLGFVQGFLGMAHAVTTGLDNKDKEYFKPSERRMRSVLEFFFSGALFEGSVETLFPDLLPVNTLGDFNLTWRYAFYFLSEFILGWNEWRASSRLASGWSGDGDYQDRRWLIKSHMAAAAFATAAWLCVAWTADITNRYGIACMVASAIGYACRDVPRLQSFFEKVWDDIDEYGSNSSVHISQYGPS